MKKDTLKLAAVAAAALAMAGAAGEQLNLQGTYHVECIGPDGQVKWRDTIKNLVTTAGKNDLLDKYLSGSAYTAAFYVGLISSVDWSAVNAADTMSSHAGWKEAGPTNAPAYSQSTRPAAAWGSAAAGSKALSAPASFSITSAGTVKGMFLTTGSAKDGTTGVLFSAGAFTGGDKIVANGDTLNVSYSLGA